MKNFQTSFEFFSLFGGAVILFFRFGIDGLLILIPLMIFVNTFKQAERNKLAPVNYDKPNKDLVVTLPLVVQTKDHVDVVVEPCKKETSEPQKFEPAIINNQEKKEEA